ncbi:hypothetical protein [Pseudoduganella violacea]|uniref:Uncharacterized protein n=1 Tax=Pseudoduganella violacea TaxID=1715466 RepID=A0A7W5BED8_9BURK|nr:hypothetical protein [Pseudoduganella violacea]MBB3121607.1 hypothetical protein [Pseudoduganella violacea]
MNQLSAIDAAHAARGPGATGLAACGHMATALPLRERRPGPGSWRGKAGGASAAGRKRPGHVAGLSENAALQDTHGAGGLLASVGC